MTKGSTYAKTTPIGCASAMPLFKSCKSKVAITSTPYHRTALSTTHSTAIASSMLALRITTRQRQRSQASARYTSMPSKTASMFIQSTPKQLLDMQHHKRPQGYPKKQSSRHLKSKEDTVLKTQRR